ncbi:cytochrome P450 [Sistotremastrum suecicum HHB10207 ss-3]|uniref:Cytochrome P450 n=1 Tax=Sistotremastrum suecicum HHB10207 ss-3 TaxID=1314776 RepID=A0A166AWZ4_9AGAM|nr:cytochrome P450 [Sistotremastrum suecicum HHB10207 ss-3]
MTIGSEDLYPALLLVCLAFSTFVVLRKTRSFRYWTGHESLPFPPGPKGLPVLGNIFQMPQKDQWHRFGEWAKQYGWSNSPPLEFVPLIIEFLGNIIYLSLLGKHVVVLTSYDEASALLNARGSIYSDRPKLPLIHDHAGWDNVLSIIPWGESVHMQRRMLNGFFNPSASRKYHSFLEQHSRILALQVVENPLDFDALNRMHMAAVIMWITYGHQVTEADDDWVIDAKTAINSFDALGVPGSHLIDIFPILGRLPYWVWGKTFAVGLKGTQKGAYDMIDKPYNQVKQQVKVGTAEPSITAKLLEDNLAPDGTIDNEREISGAAGIIYAAGADTTNVAVNSFIVAMAMYPEVQMKARKELDDFLRGERLPNIDDMPFLPYLLAVMKESLRIRLVAPLGLPHATIADDVYKGMFIPKGAMVLTDMWTMCHDPHDYPNPHQFDPERFLVRGGGMAKLRSDVRDPEDIIFGFGRRVCVGRHVAIAQIWIIMATILSTFEISLPRDQAGKEVHPTEEHLDQNARHESKTVSRCLCPPL